MFNKSFHIIFNKYYFSQISSLKESSIKHSSIGIHNGGNIFTPKFSYPLKNEKAHRLSAPLCCANWDYNYNIYSLYSTSSSS